MKILLLVIVIHCSILFAFAKEGKTKELSEREKTSKTNELSTREKESKTKELSARDKVAKAPAKKLAQRMLTSRMLPLSKRMSKSSEVPELTQFIMAYRPYISFQPNAGMVGYLPHPHLMYIPSSNQQSSMMGEGAASPFNFGNSMQSEDSEESSPEEEEIWKSFLPFDRNPGRQFKNEEDEDEDLDEINEGQ